MPKPCKEQVHRRQSRRHSKRRQPAQLAHGRSTRGSGSHNSMLPRTFSSFKSSDDHISPTVSLVLEPRNMDGKPIVPRSFTQQLNMRPFTKDQRTEQLRKMLVKTNPMTLRRPESFHVTSFFDGAAPGFHVGAASTRQLDPPHRLRSHVEKYDTARIQLHSANGQHLLIPSFSYVDGGTSVEAEDHEEPWCKLPNRPHVDDQRLWKHYGDRALRKPAHCNLEPCASKCV